VQLLLIQGQALKTFGLEAMLQIDEILDENKFNSQLVVLAPALLVVGALYKGASSVFRVLIDDRKYRQASFTTLARLAAEMTVLVSEMVDIMREAKKVDPPIVMRKEGHLSLVCYLFLEELSNSSLPREDRAAAAYMVGQVLARGGHSYLSRRALCTNLAVMISAFQSSSFFRL